MWRIFQRRKRAIFFPPTTSDPPRIHHKNTTQKHLFFQNPYQKTPVKPKKTGSTGA